MVCIEGCLFTAATPQVPGTLSCCTAGCLPRALRRSLAHLWTARPSTRCWRHAVPRASCAAKGVGRLRYLLWLSQCALLFLTIACSDTLVGAVPAMNAMFAPLLPAAFLQSASEVCTTARNPFPLCPHPHPPRPRSHRTLLLVPCGRLCGLAAGAAAVRGVPGLCRPCGRGRVA